MSKLAIKKQPVTLFQEYGYVRTTGDSYVVHTDAAVYAAMRAPSCLLEPVIGDKVLLVTDTDNGVYILAVLERVDQEAAQLTLPGNTQIKSGKLQISAREGISLETASEMSLLATQMKVSALQADVAINNVSMVGKLWRACVDQFKLVGRSVDLVLERSHQRLTRSYRHVQETDHVIAGQIDYQAEATLALHSKYTLMTADELVKVDADQIHMG